MDWLLFAFALELGAIRGTATPPDSSYVQMESGVIVLEHLEIGGTIRSYQVPHGGYTWWPYRLDYTATATVTFGMLSFGVEHQCTHPVVPWEEERFVPINRSSDQIFIRIATPRTRP